MIPTGVLGFDNGRGLPLSYNDCDILGPVDFRKQIVKRDLPPAPGPWVGHVASLCTHSSLTMHHSAFFHLRQTRLWAALE